MLATADGTIAGSVSGGCVESATAIEIGEAIGRGTPKLVTFGVTDERAWEVGLACGGTIKVFVEPGVRPEVLAAARGPGGEVVATVIEGPGTGDSLRIFEDGRVGGTLEACPPTPVRDAALDALRREDQHTGTFDADGGPRRSFSRFSPPAPAGDLRRRPHRGGTGPAGAGAGLPDHRRRWPGSVPHAERFPEADELILAWPAEAFAQIGLDAACYVCILSHDPKFDEPALEIALRSPARYVGAIGSRKTQASRRERLRSGGSPTRRSPGCTGQSGWSWAAASPPRRRWRFWRR